MITFFFGLRFWLFSYVSKTSSGHFREVWGSSEEMEQWFREHFACRRSGLLQESMQFDVANFANVAKAMTKLGWPRM